MIEERYKDLECNSSVYFLLKALNINIKTDTVITFDGLCFYYPECTNIQARDFAYKPSVFAIFKYIEENYKLNIHINKQDEKYEWLVFDSKNKPIAYSGELKVTNNIRYNMGKNIPENREYFNTEIEAINDVISELLILI